MNMNMNKNRETLMTGRSGNNCEQDLREEK